MANYLTQQGLKDLQLELKEIIEIKMPEILDSINKAMAEGDLRENSGLDAAKLEREKLETRSEEIRSVLNDYQLIDESSTNSKMVRIGSTVKVKYLRDNAEFEFRIVGMSEADALNGKISNESPLAVAILGKKVGDTSNFKTKSGVVEVKVLEIIV
jgi:transcription elongation factor GreA